MNRAIVILQGTLQIFVSLGAIVCGIILVFDPTGTAMKMSVRMLSDSPFADFFIPGLILFLVNGAGQLVAGVLTLRRSRASGLLGAVFGIGLMIWIFVQVNMIGGRAGLQYTYFAFGVIETAFAFFIHGGLLDSTSPSGKGVE